MRSIIIGGGVAGCAIAAALRGVSGVHDSVMIEKRAANDPAGHGVHLDAERACGARCDCA